MNADRENSCSGYGYLFALFGDQCGMGIKCFGFRNGDGVGYGYMMGDRTGNGYGSREDHKDPDPGPGLRAVGVSLRAIMVNTIVRAER